MGASMMTSGQSNPYGNYRMFSPATPSVSPAYPQVQQVHPRVNPFVGQLADSSVRRSSQASDLLQQGTNFSMMTSLPTNPHSSYRMFSPVVPSTSTAYNSGYLNNLKRNPMFQDLQILQNQECYWVQVPANLITSWNLMHLPSMDSSPGAIPSQGRPFIMNAVKTDRGVQQHTFEGLDDSGKKDSFDCGFKSDLEDLGVEVEAILNNDKVNDTHKNCAQMISMSPLCGMKQNNTGEPLDQDEKCAEKTNFFQPDSMVNLSPVEPVSGESGLINNETLMTPDQCGSSQPAFLDLNLSVNSTPKVRNNPSVELSPLNDEDDFLFRIASGISEKSNVQSNSQSQARSPIASFYPELQASSSSQQNSDLDIPVDSTFGINHSMKNTNHSSPVPSDLPCLKTHNVFSSDAANILSMCELQLQYPYPVKEEVKELVEMTGVTNRPVTKWMVNKHSHFSTLSITEDNRPIKFKCKGKGKKRKQSEMGKDD